MDAGTRNLVRKRAGEQCEYCHIPESAYPISFHIEHIVASVHQRNDDPINLAWACPRCNAYKGSNLVTIDPETSERVDLFNPRSDVWQDHFSMKEYVISGLSPVGRGSAHLLKMNEVRRIELRQAFMS